MPQPNQKADNGRRSQTATKGPEVSGTMQSLLTATQKSQLAQLGIHVDVVRYTGTGYDETMLKFDSSLYFENAIHLIEDLMPYNSFKGVQATAGFRSWEDDWQDELQHWADTVTVVDTAGVEAPDPVIWDDLFAETLSEKGVIQINDHIFRIDLENNQVRVIKATEPDKIPWLMDVCMPSPAPCNGYDDDEEGEVFPPNVPVLPMLTGELDSISTPPPGCGSAANSAEDEAKLRISNKKRAKAVLTYQKGGIWFSIQAKTKGQKRVAKVFGVKIWKKAEVGVLGIEKCWGWYTTDCNSGQQNIDKGQKEDKKSKVSYASRPYAGFRPLTAFDVYSIHYRRADWGLPKEYFLPIPGPTAPSPPALPLHISG